jgi:hypothetical protein
VVAWPERYNVDELYTRRRVTEDHALATNGTSHGSTEQLDLDGTSELATQVRVPRLERGRVLYSARCKSACNHIV